MLRWYVLCKKTTEKGQELQECGMRTRGCRMVVWATSWRSNTSRRLEGGEGVSREDIWERHIQGRGNCSAKGLGRSCLGGLRERENVVRGYKGVDMGRR